MKPFVKVFDHDTYGQILVVRENGEESDPIISVSILAPEPLDVCKLTLKYPDSDEGYAVRDQKFEELTAEQAAGIVERGIWPTVQLFDNDDE